MPRKTLAGAIILAALAAVLIGVLPARGATAPPPVRQTAIEVQTGSLTIVAYCAHVSAARIYGLTRDVAAVASGCSAQPGPAVKPPPRALHAPARLVLVLPGFQILLRCTQVVKFGDLALFLRCSPV